MSAKKHASTPRINKGKKVANKSSNVSGKQKLTNEIAARVSSLRLISDQTQDDLAKKMGVNLSSVKAWEQGNNRPTLENLKDFTKIFNTTYEYLIEGIEPDKERIKSTEYARMVKERIYLLDYIEHLRKK